MSNVPPQPKIDQIVWFENHWPLWEKSPTSLGLTALQVNAINIATQQARAAYEAALAAKQAAKNATIAQDQDVRSMLRLGRDAVNMIKSFIEQAGNPALWAQAGLEPPAPAGTAPAPTTPHTLAASLDSEGNVLITWRASQPRGVSGVIYSVRRSIDGGEFVLLDSVGEKRYTDDEVLTGTRSVSYTVQAKRGRRTSPLSPALTVRFGRGEGAARVIKSTVREDGKAAA